MTPEQMAEAKKKAEEAATAKKLAKEAKDKEKEAKAVLKQEAAAQKQQTNGVTRPKDGTKTGRVWTIAEQITAKNGLNEKGEKKWAARKDVIAQGEAEGLNAATIATQYGRWRKSNGLKGPLEAPVSAPAATAPTATPAPAAPTAASPAPVQTVTKTG